MAKAAFTVNKLETDPYDNRLISRTIKSGTIKSADYKKYLKGLKDLSNDAETIEVVLGEDPNEVEADNEA